MKKTIGALAALALLLATVGPVQAGGYYRSYSHHGYGHDGYSHHGYRHRHGHSGAYVALGVIGGAILLGSLLAQPSYSATPAYQPSYPAPRARNNCQPTTGTGYHNGRLATFGGTWCQDAYGNGYVIEGSEYLIGYAQ